MSFKRREKTNSAKQALPTGVRPSAANGVPVTSTGCVSLDTVLSGHGGIPIGSGILIEENGTTDFAAVLLRYYAAEGLLQGHHLWIGGGIGESWIKDLPAATDSVATETDITKRSEERMKIAWRYSGMGDFGSGLRNGPSRPSTNAASTASSSASSQEDKSIDPYCHAFDLTKRAVLTGVKGQIVHSPPAARTGDPFAPILSSLVQTINQTSGIVRCVLPNLLSPAIYPPSASASKHLVKFINNLRLVLRAHASRLVVMLSLPLDLYPRAGATTTWIELLLDGIIELVPFSFLSSTPSSTTKNERKEEAGLIKIHKTPALDRPRGGGGGGGIESDLSFKVTRKRFTIEAWSLPALDDEEPREGGGTLKHVKQTTVDVSF